MNAKDKHRVSPLVLVVDNALAVTGGINAVRHATGPLHKQYGLRFAYILPLGSKARAILEADGYPVYELPFVEISRSKTNLLRYVPYLLRNGWMLYRLARREGATIIHANDFYNLAGYVAKLMSLGKLQVITHVRFLPQSLPQPLARTWRWLASVLANRIVCVSHAVGAYFKDVANARVIYDPLPGQEHHPATSYLPHSTDTIRFLYLASYIQGKGQDLALQAFRQAYAQDRRLRLHYVGGDMGLAKNQAFRQKLEEEVAEYNLAKIVTFEGFATDVEAAIKAADVVLNFSESESFSLTCLDALYYGTALIASDCGGPAELFEHDRSGLLVPNRDVAAMTAAIIRLGADASLRAHFAEAGRLYVRQKFAPANTYQKLGELYRQVLAGG